MLRDARGLVVSAASEAAVAALNHAISGFLSNRADFPERVAAVVADDPELALGHCLKAVLGLASFKQANVAAALGFAQEASRLAALATERERRHAEAVEVWASGAPGRAAAIWEAVLRETPHDVLAFRLVHFLRFWEGRPDLMLRAVEEAGQRWAPEVPGWSMVLACRCFALEECGYYTEAEAAGREAIMLDPSDMWAAHGVAHVLEMQGRRREGLAWVDGLRPNWKGANNLRHHLWWHVALYSLEQGETERVLELYNGEFRNLGSPLTKANPDLYIDVQNAASMLFRLRLRGVDVGRRWEELAELAERRIGDCVSAFTLPHWMMALGAAGRFAAAERLLETMRAYREGNQEGAAVVGDCALPVSEAVLAYVRRDYAGAVAAMRRALGGMYRMGGSHAQQDVFHQLFLDAAVKAGFHEDARVLLERAALRYPVPLGRRIGYAEAARAFGFA
jgi:tetratricopeptide (TPR) repeat protein